MIAKRGARWRVVVQAGRDPLTGKRRQLSGSARTEREAVALERRLRLLVEAGHVADPTVDQVVGQWWASRPGWASLTPAERQVVALVTEGLTNPQVGERLFISRRTVQAHLGRIFTKLGVSSRTELATEATRRSAERAE